MTKTVQSEIINYTRRALNANEIMSLSYMFAFNRKTKFMDAESGLELVSPRFWLRSGIYSYHRQGRVMTPSSKDIESFDPEPELDMRREWFAKNSGLQAQLELEKQGLWDQPQTPEQNPDLRRNFVEYSKANYQIDFASMVKAPCDLIYFSYQHSFADFYDETRVRYFGSLSLGSYSPMFGVFVVHDLAESGNFHLARVSVVHHNLASMENIQTNIRDIFGDAYNNVMPLLEKEFAHSDEVAWRTMNSIIENTKRFENLSETPRLKVFSRCFKHIEQVSTARLQMKLDIVNKALEQGLDFNEVRAMMRVVFG